VIHQEECKVCNTCLYRKDDVCKYRGEYEYAKIALPQPINILFRAVLECTIYVKMNE
jgi:hypothetical protein